MIGHRRIDFVKVDRSIVRNVLQTPAALTELNAVPRVGEVIGVEVIAECVEDQDILMRLKSLGIGYDRSKFVHIAWYQRLFAQFLDIRKHAISSY